MAKLETQRTRPGEAAILLEKALAALPEGDPRLPESLMQLGAAWLAAGEPGKAAAAWERTAKLDPGNLDIRRRLAAAYADNFLPEQAIAHLQHIVENGPITERATTLQQIARLYSASGHPGEAMKALERAVAQTSPGNWLRGELLAQIIRIAQRQRVEGDLEAKWKRQVQDAPRDIGGYLQLVEFYERTGELEKQREWLEKVVTLAPKTSDYRLKLARLQVSLESLEKAAALYDEVLAAQPGNTDLVFERARLDLQREDSGAARTRIAALLKTKPDDESLRTRALEFYQEHHLHDLVEQQLKSAAAGRGEDALFDLASFYFSQRRVPDGLATLKTLGSPQDAPERRAALAFRTAQLLKSHGELGEAVESVRTAISIFPESREYLLLLGDLQNTRTEYVAARAAFEKAYALSKTDADRFEVDGRTFQSIREMHAAPAVETPWTPRDPSRREPAQAAVEDYIRSLMALAIEQKSPKAWLRVAQWKAWNGDKASAVTFGNKASELDPKDPAPHEFLARQASTNGDPGFALIHLRELLELNPAGRAGYLREIAQLHMQRGNTQEALSVYEDLVRANPGNAAVLIDLASAQERARRLDDAAATLRKALAMLPAPRQREASSALLRVLQELQNHEEASAMLLRAVEETPDDRERLARFDELLLYSQQHGRMAWLRAKMEDRRKLRADDYFTAIALGRVMKVLGEKAAAFELFADAALSAPNQAEALPALIIEAEELQRLDTAVRLQEQFTRVAPQEGPDGFIKLASLCEKTGDLEGAERAWQRAVGKFPRDVEVLRRASDFQQSWGDPERATTLLRKLLIMEPTNARVAYSLGTLEFEAGHLAEAKLAFEMVMRLGRAVSEEIYPPDIGSAQASANEPDSSAYSGSRTTRTMAGYSVSRRSPDTDMRLGALRNLALIARRNGGQELQNWIAEWKQSPDTTESLWALYFSGGSAVLLDRIEARIARQPGNATHRKAWLWIAMESGAHDRVSAWLHTSVHSIVELDVFSDVFGEFVKAHPELVTASMLRTVFPAGARTRLAPAAVALSAARRYPEALAMGVRVFDFAGPQRPGVGRELARMYLTAGQSAEALKVLGQATQAEGEWLDSKPNVYGHQSEAAELKKRLEVYDAMREYCLLASDPEREAFIRTRLESADPRTIHGLLTRVVLYGINGDDAKALEALDAVMATRPMTGVPIDRQLQGAKRHWLFLKIASDTLVGWGFPQLADRVWEHVFGDESLLRSQIRQSKKLQREWDEEQLSMEAFVDDARISRDALLFISGDPVRRETLLNSYAANPRGMSRLIEVVESHGALDAAVLIALRAWERAQEDPGALRRLVDACNAAGDEWTAEQIRRRVLAANLNPGSDGTPIQFADELSQQLEQRGDIAGALKVITDARARIPNEMSLSRRYAVLLQLAGRTDEAEAEMRRLARSEGGNAHARDLLAQMLQRQRKNAEALAIRRKSVGSDPQLPLLFYRAGQVDEARSALEKLSGSYAVYASMSLAEAMGLAGDAKGARSVLVAAAAKTTDPKFQLQIRTKLLRIPGAPPTPQFAARMAAKSRRATASQPELQKAYFDFFDRHAAKFGIGPAWETECSQAWANGSGPLAAGLSVLRQRLTANDSTGARKVCEQIASRADATGATIEKAITALAAARQDDLRLLLVAANARNGWPRPEATLAWIETLREMGRGEQARDVLKAHSWLAMFDGGAPTLASMWLDLGDATQAGYYARRALEQDAMVRIPTRLALMARIHIANKKLPAARLLLQRAFAMPSCRDYDALAEYLDAAGELPRWQESVTSFHLHPIALHGLKLAIFARLEKQGRAVEALDFVAADPSLISALTDESRPETITPPRLRTLATKSGTFPQAAKVFAALVEAKLPGANAELAALEADRLEATGKPADALASLEQAATLDPSRWEFSRRVAQFHFKSANFSKCREALALYLSTGGSLTDREAAFEMWDACK